MKKIAVVILNFNGEKNTIACLATLIKLKTQDSKFKIMIIDNGSTDGSVRIVKEFIREHSHQFASGTENLLREGEARLIENRINLGFAAGNNVGIRYALADGADYILVLNNDTLVDKDLISELLKVADSDEKIGIVVPKIYFAKGYEFHKDRYQEEDLGKVIWYAGGIMDWKNIIGHHRGVDEVDSGQYQKVEETELATGCCMLVKKEVFQKVGIFDEKYFLYYEDADLSQKVKGAGYKIVYAPQAIVWHKNAGSAEGSGSKLQDYYITRNRLLFGMRWAPWRAKLALLKESLTLLFFGRPWQRRGVLDFYLGCFGGGSYSI